jgi:hypothetical protein
VLIREKSIGCVNVGATQNPDPSQPHNPGLMQSNNGVTFVGNSASNAAQQQSITQMIIDGTQGTASGWGLVQVGFSPISSLVWVILVESNIQNSVLINMATSTKPPDVIIRGPSILVI